MLDKSCIKRCIFLRKERKKKSDELKAKFDELKALKEFRTDTLRHISTVRSILYRTASQLRMSPIQGQRKVKYVEQLKAKQGQLTLTELLEVFVYIKTHSKTKNLKQSIAENQEVFNYDDYTMEILMNSIKTINSFKKSDNISDILNFLASELELRGRCHDYSKLLDPEAQAFIKVNHKVKDTVYDSDEYKQYIQVILKEALGHHYSHNSHHPEFYGERGVAGMNLIDIIEMMADWKASSLRYKDGDILKGLVINKKRFGYSDGLNLIFVTTAEKFYKFQIEWVNIDGSKGFYRADRLEDIYNYMSFNIPKIRKKDLKILRHTLLKGVTKTQIEGYLRYTLNLQDYGDLSAYCVI